MQSNAASEDSRNVIDRYKGVSMEQIIADLDKDEQELQLAVENLTRDYNMGTIIRSANAFGVRRVHIIGRRQWNKRGAMMTDKYLHVQYHSSVDAFMQVMRQREYAVIAADNVPHSTPLGQVMLPRRACLVFGSESDGLSTELLNQADAVVAIEQFGSTRSINVGVAAGIMLYEWVRRHRLPVVSTFEKS